MLDNLDIFIEECEITYFNEEERKYYVDCWWTELKETDNKEYACEEPRGRGASVATISEDGNVKWKDNFKEAITEENDNSWVIEEINSKVREIKSELNEH